MRKKERIQAAVNGGEPDRLPYGFWTHMPGIDLDPERLADETYRFCKSYDLDFIKTMNNGMYPIEDFGCKIDYSQIPLGGVAKVTETPVRSAADWKKLEVCSIEKGSLARELRGLDLLLRKVKQEEIPVLFTVFSPLTTANKLSGNTLRSHLDAGEKEAVHYALRVITETTCALVREAIARGADGIFFATQSGTYSFMNTEEFQEFGVPYDCQVLEAAKDGWINTIHAHGTDIMYETLKDYPVHCFNWHAWETLPAVDEAHILSGKCLMGGLNRTDITNCRRNEVRNQIFECFRLLKGRNMILTPGCVIRYPLDEKMLRFIRQAKDEVEERLRA